ncbi:MAG TPA: glycerol-3-phosphate 1-O-acyltransferase PlsY [Gemmatimonadaceae bacterium]|jgi:glycerol-3-phosphate acyltransferase PlsY|nr:glycerol-3-phosphate 1-O-acyltransferase PlsY [Gemmatimonadaceae bacterium]
MAPALHPAAGLAVAYLSGAFPTAYLAGRLVKGIDLRQHGSGNLGATNVYRLLGSKVAGVVLLVDALKGALPVLLLPSLLVSDRPELWAIAFGVAAILGHVRSPFLLWKGGGKGVATAGGVFGALAPVAMLAAIVAWGLVLWATGYVSLASLTAAALLPLVVLATLGASSPVFGFSVVVALFVFWTHRANIQRLRAGTENRFGRKAAS